MSERTLAVTGATGFVGATLLRAALASGYKVRALTRRPQPATLGVDWVEGALDRPESLDLLVQGADAVIHVAGVVNAPDPSGFERGNIQGTQAILDAAKAAGIARFVHVSSLAAREPNLSVYGWSKAEAERVVVASGLEWVMVRPPWVYGPGDMDTLDMFRMARTGVVMVPPNGHVSVIHVGDLARLLLSLTPPGVAQGQILEADDGQPGGWTNKSIAKAIAKAVGRNAVILATPRLVLRIGAWADRFLRGDKAKLTADRVRYFCHPDWRIDPKLRPEPSLWQPQVDTLQGLKETATSYRAAGLL
ncbi:MAG: hypothetical protein RL425_47 [Pseudomonadota bacterium]|jgi:uncharacterized protein YbjT (DUF2867 family)